MASNPIQLRCNSEALKFSSSKENPLSDDNIHNGGWRDIPKEITGDNRADSIYIMNTSSALPGTEI